MKTLKSDNNFYYSFFSLCILVKALSAENDKLRKEMKAVLVHTSLSENRDRQPGSHMRSDKRLSSQSRGSEFETGSFRNDPVIENVNM